jgi:hypothetical protein
MYITTNERSLTVGEAPTPPRLRPRCYSLTLTTPATYDALEEAVRRWISACVMSRTETRPGVPIRRERELVTGNPTLRRIWDQALQYMKGKRVKINADYIWGKNREESIKFSTTASPPPPPPPPLRPPAPAKARAACPPTTCAPVGPFRPSTHGFKFDNLFSLTIPLPGPLPPITPEYGLCGGMASAALDYFLSCIPIPSTRSAPAIGTPLYNYLFSRLLDSLGRPGFDLVRKFLSWTQRPDTTSSLMSTAEQALGPFINIMTGPISSGAARLIKVDGVQELTAREEFPKIAADLSAGRMVVLGLVYKGPGSLKIWENHQVLAHGITRVSPTVTDFKIYDPNYNGNDAIVIRCESLAGGTRVRCTQIGGQNQNVRGFFRMPYRRVTPPCLP